MRILLAVLYIALAQFWASDVRADGPASLWDFNGSQVFLYQDGPRRRFTYKVPNSFQSWVGAEPGALLFDGEAEGNRYSGTAYVYVKNCGRFPFETAGSISTDQSTITLLGRHPTIEPVTCEIVGYGSEPLVFHLNSKLQASTTEDSPDEGTAPIQVASTKHRQSKSASSGAGDLDRSYAYKILTIVVGFFVLLIAIIGSSNAPAPPQSTPDKPPAESSAVAQQPVGPSEPAPQSMSLKLKRSQRTSFMGKPIFVLDARMALSPEEYSLVKKHDLGGHVVYDSKSRQQYADATIAELERTREHPSMFADTKTQLLGAGKTMLHLGRASLSAAMAALSLRITVDRLISGVHIECKSMDELLGAEVAIMAAARNLKAYLERTRTFDGREEVIEL